MGSLTLSKIDRLYWMGRYAERVNTTLRFLMKYYDQLIDGQPMDHREICERLTVPDIYTGNEDFISRFTFDETNPDSIYTAADRMLGNGMMLRETISSATLSYLQMAFNDLISAKKSDCPMIEVQAMIDSIMAFRGSFDDTVEDEGVRNVVKCGWTAERCILYLRLGEPDRMCLKEMGKLIDRVKRTPVRTRSFAFAELLKATAVGDGGKLPEERGDLIHAAEELVEI
ncbi:MAG: alpha-E domain-containing protein [Selenomonas sp.]|uniref:alpha-E domain-containing protein n=1 Tax=Selenomonas sp. TaxID=2053611 RepID=UPI002600B1FD|nr:alpha-E domain-containing protein [Selenomonas sp.]MCI6101290.1 alpha-E domain-containing protein [Selenomonas sp.]MCI6232817.1 alpha-E domain-containing protein [Selenomonas sp.]